MGTKDHGQIRMAYTTIVNVYREMEKRRTVISMSELPNQTQTRTEVKKEAQFDNI